MKNKDLFKYIEPVAEYLKNKGCDVFIDDNIHGIDLEKIGKRRLDLIISMGGDGTLLFYKKRYLHLPDVLFTAINLGYLGFMADVEVEQFSSYFDDIFNGNFIVEKRSMLHGQTNNGKESVVCTNDIVFHRGHNTHMIELRIDIDGNYFNTFRCDGLIVSTPTGSTAYTLAAGGPLVYPTLKAIIMTPICGHTLSSRPFVGRDDSNIVVTYEGPKGGCEVTIDGLESFDIEVGASWALSTDKRSFNLISYPKKDSFFSTLREKLHWRGMTSRNPPHSP